MNLQAALNTQFVQIALPIMVTLIVASIMQNKRLDDLNKRIDDLKHDMNRQFSEIKTELREIRNLLQSHDQRITRLA